MLYHFLNLSRPAKRIVSVFADIFFLSFAFWLSLSLRYGVIFVDLSIRDFYVMALTCVVTVVFFVRCGLYRAVIRFMSNKALLAVCSGALVSALALTVFSFLFKLSLPRSVPLIYWFVVTLFTGGSRLLVRSYIHNKSAAEKSQVIIYGAGSFGIQLSVALNQGNEYLPVAFVDDDPAKQGTIVQGIKVYSGTDLPKLLQAFDVEKVLLAISNASSAQRRLILRFLEPLPVQIQTIPGMSDIVSGRARVEELRDLEIEDLLGRDPVVPNESLYGACIRNKNVMVTGAGGSIGSELCRQILQLAPAKLILFEMSEYGLYQIENELRCLAKAINYSVEIFSILGSIQNKERMETIMRSFSVNTLYHAAAYKHVPIVEHNIVEGVYNNIFGTLFAAESAIAAGVETFVLISTDKAVRPTNIMGASKRMAELVLQSLSELGSGTRFCMVRFGNVLGSSGSVVPLFRSQIKAGGPVTVTHPDMVRYFMTIPEAAQLVLQAGSLGVGGEVFVLDMGEQVKIDDLARKMIRLMGLDVMDAENPEGDIEIVYTGLRPGEKLFEELLIGDNPQHTEHPRIMKAMEVSLGWEELKIVLGELEQACSRFECEAVRKILISAPTGFSPNHGVQDLVWQELDKTVKERPSSGTLISFMKAAKKR